LTTVTFSDPDPVSVVSGWVRSVADTRDLTAEALAWAARVTKQQPEQLRHRLLGVTDHDFEWSWGALPMSPAKADTASVCRALLKGTAGGVTPDCVAQRVLEGIWDGRLPPAAEALGCLAEVAGGSALPALLFMPCDRVGQDWLAGIAQLLTELLSGFPALAAAVAVDSAIADSVLTAGPQTHALAVLREGVVPVDSLDEKTLADRLRAAGVTGEATSAVRRLAEDGASEELVAALVEAARLGGKADSPEEEDDARSAAERFLFERLETLAATAGLFALNQSLDFHHGPALAEVDLLARSLRLVIELDGSYYHLGNPVAYRRDRRKDWELQRRDYFVLRFLSEDVVPQLEEVLDTILSAVELRRASQPE
jgi:hypothetical protein